MDQLIFASLSHTHYWYEVGMLKVPAESIKSQVYTVQNHPLFVKTLSRLYYCCTVDLFPPGTISSVVFQNIIITAVLDILEFRVSSKFFTGMMMEKENICIPG